MGLMDYKARFYSADIARWLQPDTTVPDSGNPQAWNRFSYANNNPISYIDPDGHNPIIAGALLVLAATAAGAIGGAAGYTAYTAVSGDKFDSASFWVATVGGGATTGLATGVLLAGGGPVGFLATMGVGNAIQYAVDQKLHGEPIDPRMVAAQFGVGAIAGAIGGPTTSRFVGGSMKQMALAFGDLTLTQTSKDAAAMFLAELQVEAVISSVRSSAASFVAAVGNKATREWSGQRARIEEGRIERKLKMLEELGY